MFGYPKKEKKIMITKELNEQLIRDSYELAVKSTQEQYKDIELLFNKFQTLEALFKINENNRVQIELNKKSESGFIDNSITNNSITNNSITNNSNFIDGSPSVIFVPFNIDLLYQDEEMEESVDHDD
jgi:hypothetical protein